MRKSTTKPKKSTPSIDKELLVAGIEAATLYTNSYTDNLNRAMYLVFLYEDLRKSKNYSSLKHLDDILRASVVFSHATLEEFLRLLASDILPNSNEQIINKIPLANQSPSGRADKFLLGNLIKFKNKTVKEVISQSITEYLEHLSFNNTKDIAIFLEDLGLDISEINSYFPRLQKLILRRHQIVHRIDTQEPPGAKAQTIPDINSGEVLSWIEDIRGFIQVVIVEALKKKFLGSHSFVHSTTNSKSE